MTSAELLSNPGIRPEVKAEIRRQLSERPSRSPIPRERSPLELRFVELWRLNGGPELVEEHRFYPSRRWRFDFAHVPTLTAFECEGGLYKVGGEHNAPKGFVRNAEKYGTAQLLGWVVYRMPSKLIITDWILSLIARCQGSQRLPTPLPKERRKSR